MANSCNCVRSSNQLLLFSFAGQLEPTHTYTNNNMITDYKRESFHKYHNNLDKLNNKSVIIFIFLLFTNYFPTLSDQWLTPSRASLFSVTKPGPTVPANL